MPDFMHNSCNFRQDCAAPSFLEIIQTASLRLLGSQLCNSSCCVASLSGFPGGCWNVRQFSPLLAIAQCYVLVHQPWLVAPLSPRSLGACFILWPSAWWDLQYAGSGSGCCRLLADMTFAHIACTNLKCSCLLMLDLDQNHEVPESYSFLPMCHRICLAMKFEPFEGTESYFQIREHSSATVFTFQYQLNYYLSSKQANFSSFLLSSRYPRLQSPC